GPLLADLDVRRACHPALDELVDITGETAALMVWNGHESVVVEQVPSPQQVKHTSAIGTRYDTLESSSVRVFLAWAEPDTVRAAVGRLSSTDRAELAQVRADDVAVNDGQTSAQEVGVAAPVRDYRGVVVAAVLLAAPRFRMPAELIDKRAKNVREAAEMVSRRLGGDRIPVERPGPDA
ncbi:MAG: IclR family transcriptional regulator, partial [Nocardioidaceae bacterium]